MYPPDEELIKRVRSGDKQAFVDIFDKYSGDILSYLYRYTGDYQKAEDLTLETFLLVNDNIHRYKEMGKFSSWLYRIATNCAKNEFRKRQYKTEISLDQSIDDEEKNAASLAEKITDDKNRPDDNMEKAELKEFVRRVILKLDKKYSEVLLLCDIEGLSYEEAAAVLKTNHITVGTRLRRARKMLYDILREGGHDFLNP